MDNAQRLEFVSNLTLPNVKRVFGFGVEPDHYDIVVDHETIVKVSAIDGEVFFYQHPFGNYIDKEDIDVAEVDKALDKLRE